MTLLQVGLLPVPHPILVRKYHTNSNTQVVAPAFFLPIARRALHPCARLGSPPTSGGSSICETKILCCLTAPACAFSKFPSRTDAPDVDSLCKVSKAQQLDNSFASRLFARCACHLPPMIICRATARHARCLAATVRHAAIAADTTSLLSSRSGRCAPWPRTKIPHVSSDSPFMLHGCPRGWAPSEYCDMSSLKQHHCKKWRGKRACDAKMRSSPEKNCELLRSEQQQVAAQLGTATGCRTTGKQIFDV